MPIPVPILPIAATSRAEALERNGEPVHPRLQRSLQDIDRALVARRHLRHCTYAGTNAGADAIKLDAFHADAFHADARNEPAVKLNAYASAKHLGANGCIGWRIDRSVRTYMVSTQPWRAVSSERRPCSSAQLDECTSCALSASMG